MERSAGSAGKKGERKSERMRLNVNSTEHLPGLRQRAFSRMERRISGTSSFCKEHNKLKAHMLLTESSNCRLDQSSY